MQNIQTILTKYFLTLVLILIGLTSLIFSIMEYRKERAAAIEKLMDSCASAGENIDLKINQLDTVVLNTINSPELLSEIDEYSSNGSDSYHHNQDRISIASRLNTLKGFDFSVRQLSIYSSKDLGYGMGDHIGEYYGFTNDDWYLSAVQASGKKYLSVPSDEADYFSLCRSYYDIYHRVAGVAEGRMYYSDVFQTLEEFSPSYEVTVLVYDASGEPIYPRAEDLPEQVFPYLDFQSDQVVNINNYVTGHRELAAFYTAEKSGFTLVMTVRVNAFVSPLLKAMIPFLVTFLFSALLSLFMVSFISGYLTTPLKKIYTFLSHEGSDTAEPHGDIGPLLNVSPTGIVEIDQLIGSINSYIIRSGEQTNKIITLNRQEVQAQMLALQSQMNPHFLYNSLASITEMAREGMTDRISVMAGNISQILRSISSGKEGETTIEEELELCDMYLECMKLRFGEQLHYSFQVDDGMLEYKIPKLCIQLFAENAIKAVSKAAPPWNIQVIGFIKNDSWYITVKDNGPGFSHETENHLLTQMNQIILTKTLPGLQIEGMGILNIFIRFYLLDGIHFIFDFGNNEDGGAYVQVGRKIPDYDAAVRKEEAMPKE